jgi:glycosyltransferase involved in cell wall biosynthesis
MERYDVIVGVPSYNEADSISRVVSAIDEGLLALSAPQRCLIVNLDSGSTDGTPEVFLATRTGYPKRVERLTAAPRGKGHNLFRLLELVAHFGARAAATIDSDIITVGPAWPIKLISPLLEGAADFVVPAYARNRFEGSTTNHFAYPLLYAFFGVPVRQPIGGDFGFTPRFCRYALRRSKIHATFRYGIDIFLTIHALGGRFPIMEVNLGKKLHKPSLPKIVEMSEQVFASAWHTLRQYHPLNQAPQEYVRQHDLLDISPDSGLKGCPKVERLLQAMRGQFLERQSEYRTLLSPAFLAELGKLVLAGRLALSAPEWAHALVAFTRQALSHLTTIAQIKRLSALLEPLFIWRVASFWQQVAAVSAAEAEQLIRQQAEAIRQECTS